MKVNRILTSLLAALLLTGALTACANGEDTPAETKDSGQSTSSVEGETELTDNLPDNLDYGGDEISIISRYQEGWTSGEIAVESLRSEPVNDAVYERNKAVEERLSVTINSIEDNNSDYSAVPNKVALAVNAGTHEYDIMAAACLTSTDQALRGIFVNLMNTEYLDLTKPWWTQGINEVLEYRNSLYLTTGSMLLSVYRFSFVTVFNQSLFTNAEQPFLYKYVEDGTWTLDKQIELVPLFHKDDGNGNQDRDGDVYGLISSNVLSIDPYWSSCKVDIVQKDADGDFTLVFDSGKLHDVAEKLIELYHHTDNAVLCLPKRTWDAEQDEIRDMFSKGYAAMATLRVLELENASVRNMEDQFGVVPMPKYNQAQDRYYTYLHDQFTVIGIPTTISGDRLEEVSAVLEAMGSASYTIVKPVYYEETLRTKIAQDPQSSEMMELVIDSIHVDAGILYNSALNGFNGSLRSIVSSGVNNTVSIYRAKDLAARKSLTNMIQKLDKVAAKQAAQGSRS
ncbi:MAG: hypothetical protein E7610_00635 [Ruminococcaceae bacterium]|nr:hypothetical protein [Oscillospiraceae bacterium]